MSQTCLSLHSLTLTALPRCLCVQVIQHLNVLLRGCVVRNTQWVLGLVVNTGRDTKIMMSSIDPPPKSSVMTLAINVEIRRIVMLLVVSTHHPPPSLPSTRPACLPTCTYPTHPPHHDYPPSDSSLSIPSPLLSVSAQAVCVIGATGYVIMARLDREAFSYLMYPPAVLNGDMDMALADWIIQFAYLMLLLGNFIPVSLYVSMSTIRFFQAIFMEWDRHMYHEPVDHHCEVHHHQEDQPAAHNPQQLQQDVASPHTIPHPTPPPSMSHAACLPRAIS